ncbi:MAG: hypothetical protein ACK587_15775 [Cyanobacteriota bacterium]
MTGPALVKAKLILLDGSSPKATNSGEAEIPFDFNPETLTLKVSTGQARDPARRGRQQTQNVGASQATLSFECIFDSTRPGANDGASSLNAPVETRDVRKRTKAIADLLQATQPGQDPAPQRVRFLWGLFSFDGVISQHQETFDYFSADGVPLRSKVALTLTEKEFRYNVTAAQAAPLSDGAPGQTSGAGRNDMAPREAALAALLAPDLRRPSPARIGERLAAGLALGASEALALFGSAAVPAGTVLPQTAVPRGSTQPGLPSSRWGRDAAAAGSAAASLASRVVAQRQAGLDPGPGPNSRGAASVGGGTDQGSANQRSQPLTPPPPISGHAHLRVQRALEADPRLFPLPPTPERSPLERRPRWEPDAWRQDRAVSPASPSRSAPGGCDCGCDCGCVSCRGGGR